MATNVSHPAYSWADLDSSRRLSGNFLATVFFDAVKITYNERDGVLQAVLKNGQKWYQPFMRMPMTKTLHLFSVAYRTKTNAMIYRLRVMDRHQRLLIHARFALSPSNT